MKIQSLNKLEHKGQILELVREYLEHEVKELREVSSLNLEVEELISNTFDHIDEYLPPVGGLHVAID